MKKWKKHNSIAYVLGTLLICFGAQAQAETRFYDPINISNNSGLSFSPSIAVGSGGKAYVAWYDNSSGGNEILFSKSTDRGKTFSSAVNLSNNTGSSTFPSVAVDKNGIVHVAWQDTQYGTSEILYTRSTDGGATFSSPINISNDTGTSGNIKLATDSTGRVYAVWTDESQINLARSDNGGTSFSKVFTYHPASGSPLSPALAIGSDSTLHLTWADNSSSRQVRYARSTNQGASFSTPLTIATGSNLSRPVIAVDGVGHVYIAYINGDTNPSEIYFAKSTNSGTSFSAGVNITNNTGTSINPNLAVDSTGILYMAWQDTTPGNYDSLFTRSTDFGTTFSTPVDIAPSTEGSLYDMIAVDELQNVYVAWDDNRYTNTTFEIIVAVGRENLPAVQNAAASPSTFSPNGDGVDDNVTFSASFTEPCQWQLNVYNSSNTSVFGTHGQGTLSYAWNGKKSSGATVSDGNYTYKVTANCISGYSAIPASGTITVNTTSSSTPPTISSFTVDNTALSPNGDGFKDSIAISAQFNKSLDWTLTFKNSSKVTVLTLTGTGQTVSTSWGGTDSNGQIVPDDTYKITLSGIDSNGNTIECAGTSGVACKSAKVDTVAPELSTVYASLTSFSPNGDGVNDTMSIVFNPTERALITIYIYESHGTLVRELQRAYYDPGETSIVWDGLSDSGTAVPTGLYNVKVWCRDQAGNTAPTYPYELAVTVTN